MIVSEILNLARGLARDIKAPYLWSQDELVIYYNKSVDEMCRRVKHLRDSSTASICQIEMLSGVHTYNYSAKIVEVISASLSSSAFPLIRRTEKWMDENWYGWKSSTSTPLYIIPEIEQNKLRVSPYFVGTYVVTGSANISFTSGTKTISKASGLSVFVPGNSINITGTVSNNKTVTAVTVSDTAIVVSETLVTENDTSAVLRRVEDTLMLSVARLPLAWVTVADLTGTPPIDDEFHPNIASGILSYAYLKEGGETYDPQQAMRHKGLFELAIADMKEKQIVKIFTDDACAPHYGAI